MSSSSLAVAEAIDWLNKAAALLNPQHQLHQHTTAAAMSALWSLLPPPPSLLRTAWAELVWALPDEPIVVYVLRSLAHHAAITGLVPYCVPAPSPPSSVVENSSCAMGAASTDLSSEGVSAAAGVFGDTRSQSGLQCGTWRILGLRHSPFAQDLIRTGAYVEPCTRCISQPEEASTPPVAVTLPLLYGGTLCPRCGLSCPRTPRFTRRCFLIVEDERLIRHAALVYGDGAVFHERHPRTSNGDGNDVDSEEQVCGAWSGLLEPVEGGLLSVVVGQVWRVHFFLSQTEEGQPLRVVHAAVLSSHLAFAAAVAANAAPHPARTNEFLTDHRTRCLYAARRMPFAALAECVQPAILGQRVVKCLLLLSIVHTLYRSGAGGPCVDARWEPLHLLLVGPSRSGKSSLLSAVQSCYGPLLSERTGRTHITQRRAAGSGGTPLEATWPWCSGDVLLAGTASSTRALLVDDMGECWGGGSGAAESAVGYSHALHQWLAYATCGISQAHANSSRRSCNGVMGTSTLRLDGQTLPCAAQITATVQEESHTAWALSQAFPLVARLSADLSMADSVLIGHNVVSSSVSLARHGRSRSGSSTGIASVSASPSRTSSPSLTMTSTDGAEAGIAEAQTRVGSLDATLLEDLMASAPCEAELLARLPPWAEVHAYLLDLLARHHTSLEDATARPTPHLPPPASLRGTMSRDVCGHSLSDAGGYAHSASALIDWEGSLRVLSALFLARAVLEAITVARPEPTTGGPPALLDAERIAEDAWSCYAAHLNCRAALMRGTDPVLVMLAESGRAPIDRRAEVAAAAAPCAAPPASLKRPRSRKASKVLLLERLRDQQGQLPRDGVIPDAHVVALYASLGGAMVMGDPVDVVLQQLQHEGLLLRRPGGWKAIRAVY